MHAGYTGKIQVKKKELIIKAMLLSYPQTRINKQLLAPCNFSGFEAIR